MLLSYQVNIAIITSFVKFLIYTIISNIMPYGIFYDSMEWELITTAFFSIKEMDSVVLSLSHQWAWENLKL